ncbi:MAG: superoxide dismutase copper/zinc binding protein [Paenibacillus sp.]|jgi:Cu-Zn family superoxide dismutase|nr:superoxide dismutase copper/zinc binding protein [Paenibacillus sp.]
MKNQVTHAVLVLALSVAVSGCASGHQSTGGNQNTGNPSNSTQSSSTQSNSNSAGTVQKDTPQSSAQGTPAADTTDKPVVVEMQNAQKTAIGTAELKKVTEGVEIKLNLSGLTPGKHGIHIHQNAVCEAPDFKSAGDHFNPEQKKHGMDNPGGAHMGDLPNIEADANGKTAATLISKLTTLEKGKTNSILGGDGKSLVIHAQPDDGKTDPSGNSGDRIACGIIR